MSKNRIKELLAEFNRISGTGNMRASAALLPEIIMHLVDMIEAVGDRIDGGKARTEIKGLLKDFYEQPLPSIPVITDEDSVEAFGIDPHAEVTAALASEGLKADITVLPSKAPVKKVGPKKAPAPKKAAEEKAPAKEAASEKPKRPRKAPAKN